MSPLRCMAWLVIGGLLACGAGIGIIVILSLAGVGYA